MSDERQDRGQRAAQAAIRQLARGERRQAATSLEETVRELSAEPALTLPYARVLSSLTDSLESERATPSGRVRLLCPACGVAFLDAAVAAYKRLALLEACAHCDASLAELQRHLEGKTYPKDAREVPARARLEKLEEELEHIRHLVGLEHATTLRWERTVAEAALARGLIERARGLLIRVTRGEVGPDPGSAHLLAAIQGAAEAR